MGVLDKLLAFGSEKRGKLITWVIIGASGVVFFVGVLMASIAPAASSPRNFSLVAPDIEYKTVISADNGVSFTGWHLNTSARETAISVRPQPSGSSAPVTFSTNSSLVSVTQKVPAGGTAILTVTPKDGMFQFSNPDPLKEVGNITITVSCGNVMRNLYVRIIMKPEDARVTARLQQNSTDFPNNWSNTDKIDMRYFSLLSSESRRPGRPDDHPGTNISYRITMEFHIWDTLVYSTAQNTAHYDHFKYQGLYAYNTLPLWGNKDPRPGITDPNVINPPLYPDETFEFLIWCQFGTDKDGNPMRYYTAANFKLVFALWTPSF